MSSPTISADEVAQIADQASLGLIRFDAQLRVRTANLSAHHALERRPGSLARTVADGDVRRPSARGARASRQRGAGRHVRESDQADRASLIVRARPATGGGAWVTLENVTELQRLRRIRSEFIDNLSHELRTPLANVRLLTEMLGAELAELDVPDRVRERVATIDVETGHLVQMINELLDLSRMENAGAYRSATIEVALGPLVRGQPAARRRPSPQRQGVTLAVRVPARPATGPRRRGAPRPAAA